MGQGYEVLVFAPDDAYASLLVQAGCKFIPLQFNNRTKDPIKDLRFYFQLKRLYKKYRPDFIFHYVAKPNIYGSLAAGALEIPSVAVVTGLGYAFAQKNWLYTLMKYLYRSALTKTREVWFLNTEDAQIFIDEQIIPKEKAILLSGEGVNTNFFSPGSRDRSSSKFTFLMSARLLKSKGIALYAEAARMLKKKETELQFDLIGFFEKEHPDSISQEELTQWESEGLLTYSGYAPDVRPFLDRADCFVFPSFYNEGVPRSLMEAASMELPIITTMNRGCKEVVLSNETGFTCKLNDPVDLANKMEQMIRLSSQEREQMGKKGRALVIRKFDMEMVVQTYLQTLARELKS